MFSCPAISAASVLRTSTAAACLAVVAACSGGVNGPVLPDGQQLLPTSSSSTQVQPIFDLMAQGMGSVAFHGERYIEVLSGPFPVTFREEITSNGQGDLHYRARDVSGGQVSQSLMEILLNKRRRQALLYRDPRITDVDLFIQNYTVIDLGTNPVVAGVPCVELFVQPVQATAYEPHWELSVDPTTGMTMAWREVHADGTTLAQASFETWSAGPAANLLGMQPVTPELTHKPLALERVASFQADGVVLNPVFLPQGYQLSAAARSTFDDAGELREYIRLEYSDGFQTMVLMHEPIEFGQVEGRDRRSRVDVETMASWTFVVGDVRGIEVVFASRLAESTMLSVLASAF